MNVSMKEAWLIALVVSGPWIMFFLLIALIQGSL